MNQATPKMSHFSDVVLHAVLSIESGKSDVAVLSIGVGGAVRTVTVGGIWVGDIFSWRIAEGRHTIVTEETSREVFGGAGEDGEAPTASVLVCQAVLDGNDNNATWVTAV